MADTLDRTAGAFTDVFDSSARAFSNVFDSTLGPLADVFDGSTGSFADVFDGLPRTFADLADAFTGAFADAFERLTDALKQFRIAVERRQDAIDDRRDMVEPGAQKCLRFDPFDVELDFAQFDHDADVEFDEVEHFGVQRDARLEIVKLEMDLVDLDDRHIHDHIGLVGVADFARIDQRVVLVHALRDCLVAPLVTGRFVAVAASF